MDDIEELVATLRAFYGSLARLRLMEGPEMLLTGKTEQYHSMLEDAYSAFSRIETAVDALGQRLEHEHARLDEGVRQYGQTALDQDDQWHA